MASDPWDHRADEFGRRPLWTAFKWTLAAVLVVLAIMAILVPFGWGFAWLSETARITGPQNTRDQSTAVIDDYQSLRATAGNVCDVASAPAGSNAPTLVESPTFAYRATYRRIEADYDRRMANLFEAGIVRHFPALTGYPQVAPTLTEMKRQVC